MRLPSIIFLLISILAVACSKDEPPKNLDEAIAYFEQHWSPGQLREFQLKNEDAAVTELHTTVGLWIRNNWIHGNRSPRLVQFFDSLNFHHRDDMSSTILRSLHRKLNNKDIDLPGQIAEYEAYWKPIMECEELRQKKAIELNNKLSIGDTLILMFQIYESENNRNAVTYSCPDRESPNDETPVLKVEGIVTRKFNVGGPANPFIDYRVLNMSDENVKIFMKELTPGDTTEFPLRSLTFSNALM